MTSRYEVRCADERTVSSFEDSERAHDGFENYYDALEKARVRSRAMDLAYAVWDTVEGRFVYPWKGDDIVGNPIAVNRDGGRDA